MGDVGFFRVVIRKIIYMFYREYFGEYYIFEFVNCFMFLSIFNLWKDFFRY